MDRVENFCEKLEVSVKGLSIFSHFKNSEYVRNLLDAAVASNRVYLQMTTILVAAKNMESSKMLGGLRSLKRARLWYLHQLGSAFKDYKVKDCTLTTTAGVVEVVVSFTSTYLNVKLSTGDAFLFPLEYPAISYACLKKLSDLCCQVK